VIAGGFYFEGCGSTDNPPHDFALEYWQEEPNADAADPILISVPAETVSNIDFTLGTTTPMGTDISVEPTSGVSITYTEVLAEGVTEATTSDNGPEPPSGFQLGDPPTYYELSTTASFSGPIEVCINYSSVSFADESELKLYHFEDGIWVNATSSHDIEQNIICASVNSLSPFAIIEGPWVGIDIRPGSERNSINPKSKGTVPVAILSSAEFEAPSEVNRRSLRFGRTGEEKSFRSCGAAGEDVNGDGLLDLVCHFNTQAMGFRMGDVMGLLTGKTKDGDPIRGWDSVLIVPS
jgi:hypothetical protein